MNLSLQHQSQIQLGLYEKETHRWLLRLSKSIKTGIDIGAAQGLYTLYFLKKTQAAKTLTFEPDLSNWPLLKENLRLNGIDESATGCLELSAAAVGDSPTPGQITLDSLLASIQQPCLIKMDVDGAEMEILRGAKALNVLPGIRWLIETHSAGLERECIALLRAAGFETTIIRNAWWRAVIPELRPIEHNRWLAAWKP